LAPRRNQALQVTFTPADQTNYTTATLDAHINVAAASLTIGVIDVTKVFGAPLLAFTPTFTGFVNGRRRLEP